MITSVPRLIAILVAALPAVLLSGPTGASDRMSFMPLDPDSFDAMLAAGNAALLRLMLNVLQQQVGRMRHLIDGRSADPSPTTAVS